MATDPSAQPSWRSLVVLGFRMRGFLRFPDSYLGLGSEVGVSSFEAFEVPFCCSCFVDFILQVCWFSS